MVSGTISSDSLKDVLRSLSIKRRNGVLGLSFEGGELELSFHEGKIVKAQRAQESAAVEVCSRLVAAGCLAEKLTGPVQEAGISVAQLYDLLIGKNYVSHEEFVRAKKSYEYDLLHSLRGLSQGKAQFSPKVTRTDPKQAIAVYPGQLILDFTELTLDEERFGSLFEGGNIWIDRVAGVTQDQGANDAERVLLELTEAGIAYQDLVSRSLLSRFELVAGLLALYDQRLINLHSFEVDDDSAPAMRQVEEAAHGFSELQDDEPLFPVDSITLSEAPVDEPKAAASAAAEALGSPIDALVHQAIEQLQDLSAVPAAAASDPMSALLEGTAADAAEGGFPGMDAQEEPAAGSDQGMGEHPDAPSYDAVPMPSGVRAQYKSLNYYLLDPVVVRRVMLLLTAGTLGVVALIGPEMFKAFFNALANFPFD